MSDDPIFCGECGKRLPDHHSGCTRLGTVVEERVELAPADVRVPEEVEERLREERERGEEVSGL